MRLLAVLLCASIWGCGTQTPPEFWSFEPEHLEYRSDSSIAFSRKPSFTGPGATRAVQGNTEWRGQTIAEPGRYFGAIDSAAKAAELCEVALWGTRVESEAEYGDVLAAYAEQGFEIGAEGESECWQSEAARDFEVQTRETDDGFDVALTAYVLPEGMGASAKLARFHYRVSREGTLELRQEDVYLEGPCLNWQIAFFGGLEETEEERRQQEEFLEKNQERYEQRARLIRDVYRRTAHPLPPGRP